MLSNTVKKFCVISIRGNYITLFEIGNMKSRDHFKNFLAKFSENAKKSLTESFKKV